MKTSRPPPLPNCGGWKPLDHHHSLNVEDENHSTTRHSLTVEGETHSTTATPLTVKDENLSTTTTP